MGATDAWLAGVAGADGFDSVCREPLVGSCDVRPFLLGLQLSTSQVSDTSLQGGCNVEVRSLDLYEDQVLLWGHHGAQASLDTPLGTLSFADPPADGGAAFFARIAIPTP